MLQIKLTLDESGNVQSTPISTNKTLRLGDAVLDLTTPRIMGIVNATPDSFFSGSRATGVEEACRTVGRMLEEGADLIDIGGYSTRPGAPDVSEADELERVVPVISAVLRTFPQARVSVDTFRANVARAALDAGAVMVNDVSGGSRDEDMLRTAASCRAAVVLMHMRGTPATMSTLTQYDNIVTEVALHLRQRAEAAEACGITDIVIDPGFGFAKTTEQNFHLLRHLSHLSLTGRPFLAGLSRKSMIWKTLGVSPEEALNGTTALHMAALERGAQILRVHDVAPAAQVIRLHKQLHRN